MSFESMQRGKFVKSLMFVAMLTPVVFVLDGCKQKGAGEKAGERLDEIVDNAKDGDPLLHKKGPVEKAGEAVDDTVKELKK